MKRIVCFVFLTLLCCFLPMTLFADSDFMNLVVNCPVSNMQVSLYRVADENYNLVDSFSRYSIDLKQDVQGAANALENRILMDGIEADTCVTSDSVGNASFTGLESGIYLVVGKEVFQDGVFYMPQVSLVSLSGDLSVDLKYEMSDKPSRIHVLKVWKKDNKKSRPKSIEVCLLRSDGIVVDKVILNSDNQWTYTWDNLSTSYTYSVMETSVPSGYKESCTREKDTIVLTNTGNFMDKVKKKDEVLPNSGQLWWPVPVLLFVGLVLFGLGRHLKNEE
ncbi:Cna B-type domain-containing protein [Holdemanella biformis]|uniref:Cna B-type domain-containing protein n=1 Tax=Holdemanella biformis TaxID=1735 RepID=UPI00265F4532|nr:Cna B-type domain-containing protein [Holdemanella biformis]